MNKIFTLFLVVISMGLCAQNTVGLLSYEPMKSYDGYNLIYPHNQPDVFLLNNCGEVVHTWRDSSDFRPANTAYILPNGNLIKTKRSSIVSTDPIWAGGGGAIIDMLDWDGNLLWSFERNDSLVRLHHDIAVTNQNTVLILAWEKKTMQEALDAGRDPALLAEGELWPDFILELDMADGSIIWEWHVWDHLIQDFDSTKANYGVISDNPEKVNLNWDRNLAKADWLHSNAMDFNADLNQIMLSVPYFDEFWVIDHTTTTAEAASSAGGFGGRGGDLMYRWGNPAAYNRGDSTNQTSFFQHDAHWVDRFLNFSHPDYGKIILYNNRVNNTHSEVTKFTPPWDMYTWSYLMDADGIWGPKVPDWSYTHPDTSITYSTGLSSAQVLPNGNTLVCAGRFGYQYEITPDEEIVWEYRTPIRGQTFVAQGDTLAINNNLTFRVNRYPLDFDAFDGRDLTPKGYLELNPDDEFCSQILSTEQLELAYELKLFPNPVTDYLTIEWNRNEDMYIELRDLSGRSVKRMHEFGNRVYVDISGLESGMYFVSFNNEIMKKIVVMP